MSGVVVQLIGYGLAGLGAVGIAVRLIPHVVRELTVRRLAYWSTQTGRTEAEREHALAMIEQLTQRLAERSPIPSAVRASVTSSARSRRMRKDKATND